MIRIKFQNLEESELAKEAVTDRLLPLVEKFPELKGGRIQVTLAMESSPLQTRADVFKVKLALIRGNHDDLVVEKENANFYIALGELATHLSDLLKRTGRKEHALY